MEKEDEAVEEREAVEVEVVEVAMEVEVVAVEHAEAEVVIGGALSVPTPRRP